MGQDGSWELGACSLCGTRRGLRGSLEGLLSPGEGDAPSRGQAPELAISGSGCMPVLGFKAFLFSSSVAVLWD